jgi:hypothetical protein
MCVCMCVTGLAPNDIFSPTNKLHREVGRAKDLSAPRYCMCRRLCGDECLNAFLPSYYLQYSTVPKGRVQNSTGLPIEPGGWQQDAQKTKASDDLFYLAGRLFLAVQPPGVSGVTVRQFNYQRIPDVVYLEITVRYRLISVYKLGRKFASCEAEILYQLNSVN